MFVILHVFRPKSTLILIQRLWKLVNIGFTLAATIKVGDLGEGEHLLRRSDIIARGCVLYQCCWIVVRYRRWWDRSQQEQLMAWHLWNQQGNLSSTKPASAGRYSIGRMKMSTTSWSGKKLFWIYIWNLSGTKSNWYPTKEWVGAPPYCRIYILLDLPSLENWQQGAIFPAPVLIVLLIHQHSINKNS